MLKKKERRKGEEERAGGEYSDSTSQALLKDTQFHYPLSYSSWSYFYDVFIFLFDFSSVKSFTLHKHPLSLSFLCLINSNYLTLETI